MSSKDNGSSKDTGLESRTNTWMVAGLVLMLIGVLAFPIYRFYEPTARAEASQQVQNDLASAGATLWSSTCASCHGSFGQGVDAPALNSSQFLSIVTNEQIVSIASSGVPGTEMSAYSQEFGGPLTREQITSLAACVRSWEPTAPDRPDWRSMIDAPAGGHDEGAAAGGDHAEEPADHDADGTADHAEVASNHGPPACGPGYDPSFLEDHDADGAADHNEPGGATTHDEPAGTTPHDETTN